ncbi:hypothetical protein CDAR_482111 [Caerostris darwini]|uniref:Uncharacterized protein n=1 Tax=Caerostris darwini TaxID=1538125 RepID=A0AAV4TIW5_9ARAC|nr:hypothetical protein CDAR_482111 [Caerostris darwini]
MSETIDKADFVADPALSRVFVTLDMSTEKKEGIKIFRAISLIFPSEAMCHTGENRKNSNQEFLDLLSISETTDKADFVADLVLSRGFVTLDMST